MPVWISSLMPLSWNDFTAEVYRGCSFVLVEINFDIHASIYLSLKKMFDIFNVYFQGFKSLNW